MKRKSLVKDAEENLRRYENLKHRAINIENEAIGLEIDIHQSIDKTRYFQKKELEKNCNGLRIGTSKEGEPVLYCIAPSKDCPYVSDEQKEIVTRGANYNVWLCKKARELYKKYKNRSQK